MVIEHLIIDSINKRSSLQKIQNVKSTCLKILLKLFSLQVNICYAFTYTHTHTYKETMNSWITLLIPFNISKSQDWHLKNTVKITLHKKKEY